MEFLIKLRAFMDAGGVNAFLILITGVVMTVIIIERFFFLFMYLPNSKESTQVMHDLVISGQYTKAMQVCNLHPNHPGLNAMSACIAHVDAGREAMKSALNESILQLSRRAEARLTYLALIASAATMLGLLGTIFGLIKTFAGIASADPSQKAHLLGSGIAEAMNSTAAGLIIGVLAMVTHTILAARADAVVSEAQSAGLNAWTWIEQAERSKRYG